MSSAQVESAAKAPVRDPDHVETRTLGGWPALALVAGSMLGIGIFIAPPVVATHFDQPGPFLFLWLCGGLSALFGALSVAELGAMLPRAGGDYPYLRLAWGPGFAFAAGWLQLLAIFPGSLAVMAVGTAQFQLPVILGDTFYLPEALGLPGTNVGFWSVVMIAGLTALNHIGIVVSGRAQVLLTGVPVAILLLACLGVLAHQGTSGGAWATAGEFHAPGASAAALAFLPVYFAYSGWNAAIFVGGEVRDPGRNLPRALVGGTLGVTLLYLLICVGFLSVFPMEKLAHVGEAGTAAARALFGGFGVLIVTVLIVLAMLGSINGTVLTGSRIAYAMAKQGHCFASAGRRSPRYGTPVVALWLQAAWSLVLVASGTFEELMSYASAAMLITGTLTVLAVIRLRRKMPDTFRPYRTWGYPITPLLYAGSSILVLVIPSLSAVSETGDLRSLHPSVLLATAWFVGGLVVHRLWFRRESVAGESSMSAADTLGAGRSG
jgi:APA family basic amino acid/polyamine antiporter